MVIDASTQPIHHDGVDQHRLTMNASERFGAREASPRSSVQAHDVTVVDAPAVAPKVSVVIPTLNEERNIASVLERIPALVDEVILVDGRSTALRGREGGGPMRALAGATPGSQALSASQRPRYNTVRSEAERRGERHSLPGGRR